MNEPTQQEEVSAAPADNPLPAGVETGKPGPSPVPSIGNLTEQERLVRRLPEPAPYPDHYLLVFKKSGKEWKLRASLSPGERYKKPFFESPDSLVAYIVRSDPHLRYRFSPPTYRTHDHLHSFTLRLSLEYRVSDPVALVQKLELDPLRRVVDEIDSVLQQRIKSLDWPAVEREQIDLEEVLFHGHDSGFAKLRHFAGLQGLGLERIAVVRELPQGEIEVAATALKNSRAQQTTVLEHGTRALRQSLEIELDDQLQGTRRRNEIGDGIAKSIVHTISDNVHTLDDVARAMSKLNAIQPAMTGSITGSPVAATLPRASLSFLPPASANTTPLATLLAEIAGSLGSLDCDPAERKRALSFALHVTAEVLRGEDANPETLDQHARAVGGLFSSLFSKLRGDQVKLLRRLQDLETLKKELG